MRPETSKALRVVFAGGGTGGHVMPAAATAEALCELLPGTRCLFLSTSRECERHCRQAVARFEAAQIPAAHWRGGAMQKCRFAAAASAGAADCVKLLRGFRPHALVGLGGYSCVAPVLSARLLRVPVMLFESNAVPGRVVRLLAPLADRVQVQWQVAAGRLRAKSILVAGNPVRAELFGGDGPAARARLGLAPDRPTLLVIGGSQGSLALNRALAGALPLLAKAPLEPMGGALQVLHLTGPAHLERAALTRPPAELIYRAVGFETCMRDAYAAADMVLARAGGSTLAELTALGLPSVLVPYPCATDEHQSANAAVLARAGAAVVLPQDRLNAVSLAYSIVGLAASPARRAAMAAGARRLGRPGAAAAVAAELAAMGGYEVPGDAGGPSRGRQESVQSSSLHQAA